MAALNPRAIVQMQHFPILVSHKAGTNGRQHLKRYKSMSVATHLSAPIETLAGRSSAWIETVKARVARYRVYRDTLNELSGLSNRDLADLGLHRSELRRVAYQAAYDVQER